MSMIQIRNVPEDVHRKLKARAASTGMTLSDFLLMEAKRTLEKPTRQELLERLSKRKPSRLKTSVAALVRKERDRR
jgi:antitoxin FitA